MSEVEQGFYSELNEPLIELSLIGFGGLTYTVTALIDSGVNVGLMIFDEHRAMLHWPITQRTADLTMASGADARGFYTRGYLKWLGRIVEIDDVVVVRREASEQQRRSTARSAQVFLGMGILRGHRADFTHSDIIITKLERS